MTGEPTQTYGTALPTVIFPTAPTVPISSTVRRRPCPRPRPDHRADRDPDNRTDDTCIDDTCIDDTASTTPASTTTAPTTTAPTTTVVPTTGPTTTAPTTTVAPTTEPTTTTATDDHGADDHGADDHRTDDRTAGPDLAIAGLPGLVYPASRQFPNDTNFKITVRNNSAQALRSVVTFSLPGDVELSADLDHMSCRTTGTTVSAGTTCRATGARFPRTVRSPTTSSSTTGTGRGESIRCRCRAWPPTRTSSRPRRPGLARTFGDKSCDDRASRPGPTVVCLVVPERQNHQRAGATSAVAIQEVGSRRCRSDPGGASRPHVTSRPGTAISTSGIYVSHRGSRKVGWRQVRTGRSMPSPPPVPRAHADVRPRPTAARTASALGRAVGRIGRAIGQLHVSVRAAGGRADPARTGCGHPSRAVAGPGRRGRRRPVRRSPARSHRVGRGCRPDR